MKRIFTLLLVVLSCQGYSQTASRLIAFATFHSDTTAQCVDSGGFNKYSEDRGGEVYAWPSKFSSRDPVLSCYPFVITLKHDNVTRQEGVVKFDSAWEKGLDYSLFFEQFFDGVNNMTYARTRLLVNDTLQTRRANSYRYNKDNCLIVEIDTSWSYNRPYVTFYQYDYDASKNMTSYLEFSVESSDTGNRYWYTNTYDSNNNLVDIYNQYWVAKEHKFVIDGLTHIYYTNNRPDSFHAYTFGYKKNGIDTVLTRICKYHFSPLNDTFVTEYFSIPYKSSPAILFHRVINAYDISHNKISMTMLNLDSTLSNYYPDKFEYTYNSFNQVTSEKYYSMNANGNWVFSHLYRYYYETYEPGPPFKINDLTLYPSPTKNMLTLKIEWDTAKAFTVSIFNIVGQRVMQWDEPPVQLYKKTIALPDLASGHYFMTVNCGKQRIVKRFVIDN